MIYFIADTHFGQADMIRACGRPFADATEMDETMIALWNERVSERDTVYVIGDMFVQRRDAEAILGRLKGKKQLIIGNHDEAWLGNADTSRYFLGVHPLLEVNDGKHLLTLCHYPLLTWKDEAHSYMIHGHLHNNTADDFFPLLAKRERVLNAGVELNGYRPVLFEELVQNNVIHKQKFLEKERL